MPGTVRQRMISGALDLISRKGLQATSFAEVTQATATPRGSIYHHFPGGKQELVLEALDANRARFQNYVDGLSRTSPPAFVEDFVATVRQFLTEHDLHAGSAISAVTVAAENREQLDRCSDILTECIDTTTDALVESGAHEEAARPFAAALVTQMLGCDLMVRATRRLTEFDIAARHIIMDARALPLA